MTRITWGQRIYFAAVGAFALSVGVWGYFLPSRIDEVIPWLLPPLHARFLGAMYLSGATFMLGCFLARRYAEVRVVVIMVAIWTGLLLVVSLLHLGEFDFAELGVWVWYGAYIAYPLIAAWLAWRDWRRGAADGEPGQPLPSWARGFLLVQGAVATLLALALLLAPQAMSVAWPWPITLLLAQLYSAPFLSYGIGSLLLARCHTWPEIRVAVTAMLVFAVGVLLASLIHRGLFANAGLAGWLWFGGFGAATLVLALLVTYGLQARNGQILSHAARS